ncbi:MTH865 family protein [Halegenticoccus tardaugens]|uniref:MTH865 family protein n=1 Tax=Halegenticoccus tardaugens TaxID=2071624 RepID=UPI00100B9284|nr:MTH865 family protein [Halegenticoccus tardaugens]
MADEAVEAELREQLLEAFGGADYPVKNQMDLVPALPNGPGTKFEAGDGEVSFTAMEMAAKLGSHQSFPYDSAESLVDDVMEGLRAEGML